MGRKKKNRTKEELRAMNRVRVKRWRARHPEWVKKAWQRSNRKRKLKRERERFVTKMEVAL